MQQTPQPDQTHDAIVALLRDHPPRPAHDPSELNIAPGHDEPEVTTAPSIEPVVAPAVEAVAEPVAAATPEPAPQDKPGGFVLTGPEQEQEPHWSSRCPL